MPRASAARDELDQLPITADEKVGRDPQAAQPLVIRVRTRIQDVREEIDDGVATEATRWKADVVQNQQKCRDPLGPVIRIRGSDESDPARNPFRIDDEFWRRDQWMPRRSIR